MSNKRVFHLHYQSCNCGSGNKDSEKDLRVYAEAIQNLPPVQDIAAPVEEAENLPDDDGGFDGLGSLFRGQGR